MRKFLEKLLSSWWKNPSTTEECPNCGSQLTTGAVNPLTTQKKCRSCKSYFEVYNNKVKEINPVWRW